MQITVSGKQVDVGESLRTHIESRLAEGISKYLDRVTAVHVVISRESHRFRADITVNPGTHSNITIKSRSESEDVYACFDGAAEKVQKQLRRYKRRLTNHHNKGEKEQVMGELVRARKYVIDDRHEEEKEDHTPVVIAETTTHIEIMTVSEAVMKMDLSDLPALLFFNSSHGRLNVVYRREDGNISWVDPEELAAKVA